MVKNVLVIECTTTYNWYKIFENAKLTHGEEIKVEQASWQEINCTGYFDSGLIVEMRPGLLLCYIIHSIMHTLLIKTHQKLDVHWKIHHKINQEQ